MTFSAEPSQLQVIDGWEAAPSAPDAAPTPDRIDELAWLPAHVPGTAASVLGDARALRPEQAAQLDDQDWWFRARFAVLPASAGEEMILRLEGLATVAEVYLNGEPVLTSSSMFARHQVDVGASLQEDNELAIRFRALGPLLRQRRRPRARWHTRVVAQGNLRFFRTTLLGRAPGFAPGPPTVGPWRPIYLVRRRGVALDALELGPRLDGEAGVLAVRARVRSLDRVGPGPIHVELRGPSGTHRAALALRPDGDAVVASGTLRVPQVARWWPHTHGEPVLHEARLLAGSRPLGVRRVGFRRLAAGPSAGCEVERDGLDLHVNDERVFCRGALWTPVDAVGWGRDPERLRAELQRVTEGGMNMLRLPGTGVYEEPAFYDLCDELGILVWQDFMFANMDYPVENDSFRELVEIEVAEQLRALGHRPSLTVLCGNSEVEQQVAMLGLEPQLGRGALFGELLPGWVREARLEALFVPSAPCGGDFPFRPCAGIAHYFGVGAYLRPLADARRAEVRFAAECLAFANVPDDATLDEAFGDAPATLVVHHPRWKAGVPRDVGAGWDFEDVRDHYLRALYDVDPVELRRVDHPRYLELSRAVSGEVMAEVFGEWRRTRSPCGGGLVLWWRDLVAGAGWGLIDHRGRPKVAYHHLRRALAPLAVWTTDEGLNGVVVHVANERPLPVQARLRIALYRDFELCVRESTIDLELEARAAQEHDVEAVLGSFVDVGWSYRFGPPAQNLIVASLEQDSADRVTVLSQAMRFPAARPTTAEPAASLGIETRMRATERGEMTLTVSSRRLAYGVRVWVPGVDASDDAFSVEPGGERMVLLRSRDPGADFSGGSLTALNLSGRIPIEPVQGAA